ncbi:MAG: lysine--tRNA ligase, partial [Selenomonadaceae bacterium]|nr:lysine--tRNA ligase [Selenomonadaceae bacterium]
MAKNFQQQTTDENELIKIRREKLQGFVDKGVEPFGARYEVTHHACDVRKEFGDIEGEVDAGEVSIAGRLMAIRGHGKASFATLTDKSGSIQIYFKLDVLGEEKYSEFKLLDLGDIIGLRGQVFTTKRGELTVRVEDFTLLAKSLRPLPEKFHGLKDVEIRYRQRYLDLIMNPEVR